MTPNCDILIHHTKRFMFVLGFILIAECESAKILGIMPTSSFSHQIVFQPLWKELSLRGHQVVVLTTHPINDKSLTNLTEVHLDSVRKFFKELRFYDKLAENAETFIDLGLYLKSVTIKLTYHLVKSKLVQNVLRTNRVFDLVIAEAHFPSILGLIGYYRCPWIGVSSMDPALQYHLAIGNPVHPVLNPDGNLDIADLENLNFFERFSSFIYRNAYIHEFKNELPRLTAISREYLGEDLPSLSEIQSNVSMLFTSAHPIFHNLRPVHANTIFIGSGIHLRKPEILSNNLKTFLDEAKGGAIYFSLGSNVNANILNPDFKKALLDTFANLPYHVLLKLDANLTDVPKNVLVQKWMPQQDILRHPNVKLFITQGGLQSLQEAITNDIPLIGIPFFGDQLSNVNKMVKRGYGVKLDKKGITKESLTNAIKEVMENPKYREKAREMGAIFRDEEVPSLQRAVYWTEYVIRHKGARHLRSPVVGMPAWKYYMLDVVGFLTLIVVLIVILCFVLVKVSFWLVLRCFTNKKSKKKTN
ncbi:unnamed protein product [Phaedon cochleariae]|uniref:UDP-glucuronosyltransferase n=1 Tax=Phaedon cochleariae TaxID=80249 RepID=A0A9N9SDJ2_PHACE|nr:unnamed protein product [Phaedon cochleariae]